jgi:hypothetical protein
MEEQKEKKLKDHFLFSTLSFIIFVFLYLLIIVIDSNAWTLEDSFLYTSLSIFLFYFWLFCIIAYFIILLDIRKTFVKTRLFIVIFVVFIIFASQYIWIYFLLLTLLLLIFKRVVFKNIFTLFSIIFILLASCYYTTFYTGLASDEEMIEHFYEHKAEIEELVKRYREFDAESIRPVYIEVSRSNGEIETVEMEYPHFKWIEQNDTKELMRKAGMYLGSREIFPAGYFKNRHSKTIEPVIWLLNPYSIKTAKLADEMYKESENMPSEGSYKPLQYSKKYYDKYGMLAVKLFPEKKYSKKTFSYENMRKYLYHIPEVPKIENGELLGPYNTNGNYSFRWRVNKTLNYIPYQWNFGSFDDFKCAIRKIEPQWYIYMCATKCKKIDGGKGCNDTSLF